MNGPAHFRRHLERKQAGREYPRYNVHAVKSVDGTVGGDEVEECADDHRRRICFGLYGITAEGLLEWISDHPTRAEAETAIPQQKGAK